MRGLFKYECLRRHPAFEDSDARTVGRKHKRRQYYKCYRCGVCERPRRPRGRSRKQLLEQYTVEHRENDECREVEAHVVSDIRDRVGIKEGKSPQRYDALVEPPVEIEKDCGTQNGGKRDDRLCKNRVSHAFAEQIRHIHKDGIQNLCPPGVRQKVVELYKTLRPGTAQERVDRVVD